MYEKTLRESMSLNGLSLKIYENLSKKRLISLNWFKSKNRSNRLKSLKFGLGNQRIVFKINKNSLKIALKI